MDDFLAYCRFTVDANNSIYGVFGPYNSKYSDRLIPYHFESELSCDNLYYVKKLDHSFYRVYSNDSNGSFYYEFNENMFYHFFYSQKQLRILKLEKLKIYEIKRYL